jgi:hypothetical protein
MSRGSLANKCFLPNVLPLLKSGIFWIFSSLCIRLSTMRHLPPPTGYTIMTKVCRHCTLYSLGLPYALLGAAKLVPLYSRNSLICTGKKKKNFPKINPLEKAQMVFLVNNIGCLGNLKRLASSLVERLTPDKEGMSSITWRNRTWKAN